ncbi:hypothetical protein H9I45_12680 [Polaribacter haliotis]|uniref:SdiA-regulated family protein n=1 Tax=Polaribacter haliotis TaxID=1888915 RepID=A0A7L8ADU7_9FLAO|nr:hypothetical protein [Polaribacter haliotis]QOD60190.1 hypothetical protein H9I45_12680 [Polaribacter haliotis]
MLKKISFVFSFLLLMSCQNFGQLKMLADLPKDLKEVSGTEIVAKSDLIWMINDGGNKPELFGLNEKGKIIKEIYIKAKNHDWEDLTSDEKGNIYIGDFGNNLNRRKNLSIIIVEQNELDEKNAEVDEIEFEYPNQTKFPPKKKNKFFDTEGFFYFKKSLYIFTKSRVKGNYGKTTMYKIPAKKGKYVAEIVGEFENCSSLECWITSADISEDGKKVALLSQKNVLIFTDFKEDNFLSGKVQKIELTHRSQKEGITFKDNNTLLITDEKAHGAGGNLYELKI